MNRNSFLGMDRTRPLARCVALVAMGLLAFQASAQVTPVTMTTPGGSIARVDVDSALGMYFWSVGGQNQLNQQWFYYGIGGGPQFAVNTISAASYTQPTANSLITTYANSLLSVSIKYVLTDGGTGQADVAESISIHNISGSPLNLSFFQYSDFNLGGTPGGDTLFMDNQNAFQQKGLTAIAEGIIDPAADHFEANTTGGPTSTLAKLNTTSGLILSDSAAASGDVTWAYQWLYLPLGVNETRDILKDKQLQVSLIPEPSTMALLAVGMGVLALRKRRQ